MRIDISGMNESEVPALFTQLQNAKEHKGKRELSFQFKGDKVWLVIQDEVLKNG